MLSTFSSMRGLSVAARGDEAGRLVDVLVSDESWEVLFVVVRTGSWFLRRNLILHPETINSLDVEAGELSLELTKAQLESSDELSEAPPVSLQRQRALDRAAGWVPIWPVATLSSTDKRQPSGVPRPPIGDTHVRSLEELLGYELSTRDGQAGRVDDFLIEQPRFDVRYLVVRLGSWLRTQNALVSTEWLSEVSWKHQRITADLYAEAIEAGPRFDGLESFDRAAEDRLLRHHVRS